MALPTTREVAHQRVLLRWIAMGVRPKLAIDFYSKFHINVIHIQEAASCLCAAAVDATQGKVVLEQREEHITCINSLRLKYIHTAVYIYI